MPQPRPQPPHPMAPAATSHPPPAAPPPVDRFIEKRAAAIDLNRRKKREKPERLKEIHKLEAELDDEIEDEGGGGGAQPAAVAFEAMQRQLASQQTALAELSHQHKAQAFAVRDAMQAQIERQFHGLPSGPPRPSFPIVPMPQDQNCSVFMQLRLMSQFLENTRRD